VKLDSLVVTARADRYMAEFEENRRLGLGHFFTRVELEKEGVAQVVQAFDRLGAVKVWRGKKQGTSAYVANQRHQSLGPISCGDGTEAAPCACYAQVYLNFTRVFRGARNEPLFDINSIPLDLIEAIEYYSGGAETPLKYSTLNSNCGVVVIWTRRTP
jgi:hypothetical protein